MLAPSSSPRAVFWGGAALFHVLPQDCLVNIKKCYYEKWGGRGEPSSAPRGFPGLPPPLLGLCPLPTAAGPLALLWSPLPGAGRGPGGPQNPPLPPAQGRPILGTSGPGGRARTERGGAKIQMGVVKTRRGVAFSIGGVSSREGGVS